MSPAWVTGVVVGRERESHDGPGPGDPGTVWGRELTPQGRSVRSRKGQREDAGRIKQSPARGFTLWCWRRYLFIRFCGHLSSQNVGAILGNRSYPNLKSLKTTELTALRWKRLWGRSGGGHLGVFSAMNFEAVWQSPTWHCRILVQRDGTRRLFARKQLLVIRAGTGSADSYAKIEPECSRALSYMPSVIFPFTL